MSKYPCRNDLKFPCIFKKMNSLIDKKELKKERIYLLFIDLADKQRNKPYNL